MIAYGICIGDQAKYDLCALPGLRRRAHVDALIAESTDNASILTAYNEILDAFSERDDLEAVVLLHEDLEIRDPAFEDKVRMALQDEQVAVLGVVGARRIPGLEWWLGEGAGRCEETRGVIDFGAGPASVEAVDGMLLVLSPWAVRNLRFDSERYSGFHAYDIDFCFQARAAGKLVRVIDVDVHHHTKGGLGDEVGFRLADARFREKWGLAPAPTIEPAACPVCTVTLIAGPRQGNFEIALCPSCGVGATLPAPARDLESADIWDEQYGGRRMAMRPQWMREAELRVNWLQLHVPDGKVLEVGGGTGEFCAVASQHGYEAYGAEPSAWAAEAGRGIGANITTGDLTHWRGLHPEVDLDALVAFHVFEHIHDPRTFLQEVADILPVGAVLAFEVPNFDSVHARRHTFDWANGHLADHVYHYTRTSLASIVEQEGFTVEQVFGFTTRVYESPDYWAARRQAWTAAGLTRAPEDMLRIVARRSADAAGAGCARSAQDRTQTAA